MLLISGRVGTLRPLVCAIHKTLVVDPSEIEMTNERIQRERHAFVVQETERRENEQQTGLVGRNRPPSIAGGFMNPMYRNKRGSSLSSRLHERIEREENEHQQRTGVGARNRPPSAAGGFMNPMYRNKRGSSLSSRLHERIEREENEHQQRTGVGARNRPPSAAGEFDEKRAGRT